MDMRDDELEKHIKLALYELELIKKEYLDRKNRYKSDMASRASRMLVKSHKELIDKWYFEEQIKPKPILEVTPIEVEEGN